MQFWNIERSNMIDAEKFIGVKQSNISSVCLGKRKTAGGYKWTNIQ